MPKGKSTAVKSKSFVTDINSFVLDGRKPVRVKNGDGTEMVVTAVKNVDGGIVLTAK